ncbi:MAG: hypothetical protein O7D92_04315 [Proteobacteria bacterium]|nr:hypothetical protein [Pseudomonadota bacterium]
MARVLILIAAIFLAFAVHAASAAEAPDRYKLRTGIDISYIASSGYASWTEGFVGKLRYDDNNEGLMISRAFADYEFQFVDTLKAHAAVEAYGDDIGATVDFTQAYLEWRPVPRSENRYRLKLGAFYPRISLENVSAGWSSPYSMSSSTINTWVAEELRTVGAELSVSRRPAKFGGAHSIRLQGAVFFGNDPTGSLLAWKGWSVHDRQSRFGDELPLPPLPVIQPGMLFDDQDPYVAPFREIDGQAGYYVSGEWRFNQQLLIRVMHYDNRADPTADEDGQYAWTTKFEHIGAHAALPGDWDLLFQWMTGSTVMGSVVNGARDLDTEFASMYLMLTRVYDRHRLSVRYDRFEVMENDQTPQDDNAEDGNAWTLAYFYDFSDKVSFGAESLSIKTDRFSWQYYGLDPTRTEKQFQLSLRLRFGN